MLFGFHNTKSPVERSSLSEGRCIREVLPNSGSYKEQMPQTADHSFLYKIYFATFLSEVGYFTTPID